MRIIPDSTGPLSDSTTPGETRDFTEAFTGKDFYQELIGRANAVPLTHVFKMYGVRANEHNPRIICPFKHHKGGRESTPSFYYYPETDTFCCYGCGVGSKKARGVEFVAAMEGIRKIDAAYKIIELFSNEIDEDRILTKEDSSEQLEIMMTLSNCIREFRQNHIGAHALEFIEEKGQIYDNLNHKFKNLDNKALRRIVERLKEEISSYTCQTP